MYGSNQLFSHERTRYWLTYVGNTQSYISILNLEIVFLMVIRGTDYKDGSLEIVIPQYQGFIFKFRIISLRWADVLVLVSSLDLMDSYRCI